MGFIKILLLFLSIQCICSEDFNIEEGAPGLAMDYRVHIDAGKEDCYYQYVHPGATIYTSMSVLKGGDGNAGFAVRNPLGEIVHPYSWKPNSEYEEVAKDGGYYGICIDNQFSKFSAKLINLYITTFRHDLWEKYSEELEKLEISVNEFSEKISPVDQRINMMLTFQANSRAREARDYRLLLDNNSWIQYWSVGQCMALVAASLGQVFAIRHILNSGNSSKSGPRA